MFERILVPLDGSPRAELILSQVGRILKREDALATHGRSGLSRWLTGSVTERVLRHSFVPLLIVRASAPRAARSPANVPQKRKKIARLGRLGASPGRG